MKLPGAFHGSRDLLLVVFNPTCPEEVDAERLPEAISDLQRMTIDYYARLRDLIDTSPNGDPSSSSRDAPVVGLALGPVRTDDGKVVLRCGDSEVQIPFPVIAADESEPSDLEVWIRARFAEDSSLGSIEGLKDLGSGLLPYSLHLAGTLKRYRRDVEPER